jgi:hypothetical protein
MKVPTAVHAVGDVQETASRALVTESGALGVRRVVQLAPSQLSANPKEAPPPDTFPFPTAVQALTDTHEAPPSPVPWPGAGFLWIFQVVPSQRSTSGWAAMPSAWKYPTAVQVRAEGHDTPYR